MGRVINARMKEPEKCPGCPREARVNERDTRADTSFKTRFHLLGRFPFEPGEVVPMVKSQELVQVLVLSGGPSESWSLPRLKE